MTTTSPSAPHPLDDTTAALRGELSWLIAIMSRLLAPDGCPWDREQTLDSLRPYLIEECYEVLDAIDTNDRAAHTEELGDLLLQIVFQAALAKIPMREIISTIGDKLIRRHPHVFGDIQVQDADEVLVNWDKIKAQEKADRGDRRRGALAGLPRSLPALHRTHELTRKAAKVGFRWRDPQDARAKVAEELAEVDEAVAQADPLAIRAEIGDALFALAAWGRVLGVQPEDALRQANDRFEARFTRLEDAFEAEGRHLRDADEAELLTRWRHLKTKAADATQPRTSNPTRP